MPAVREHLTPKYYVDQFISYKVDEISLLRLDPNEELNLDEQDSVILSSSLPSPKTIIEILTKSYVDSFHESSRKRRELSSMFIDQDNEFDLNKMNNLDGVTVKCNPSWDNELANKKRCWWFNRRWKCSQIQSNTTKFSESICWKWCL